MENVVGFLSECFFNASSDGTRFTVTIAVLFGQLITNITGALPLQPPPSDIVDKPHVPEISPVPLPFKTHAQNAH